MILSNVLLKVQNTYGNPTFSSEGANSGVVLELDTGSGRVMVIDVFLTILSSAVPVPRLMAPATKGVRIANLWSSKKGQNKGFAPDLSDLRIFPFLYSSIYSAVVVFPKRMGTYRAAVNSWCQKFRAHMGGNVPYQDGRGRKKRKDSRADTELLTQEFAAALYKEAGAKIWMF